MTIKIRPNPGPGQNDQYESFIPFATGPGIDRLFQFLDPRRIFKGLGKAAKKPPHPTKKPRSWPEITALKPPDPGPGQVDPFPCLILIP